MELILYQSILPYRLILRYIEKDERKAKNDTDANPPKGGWGMGSKEPIQKLFLLPAVTILAN